MSGQDPRSSASATSSALGKPLLVLSAFTGTGAVFLPYYTALCNLESKLVNTDHAWTALPSLIQFEGPG